jgi:DNA-binding MarR family transcriptional regulator
MMVGDRKSDKIDVSSNLKENKTKVKPSIRSSSTSDFDYMLWVLLEQVRDAMAKARERELGSKAISSIQASVLTSIEAIGHETTAAKISRRLIREPHSVSGLLKRTEKQGLIKLVKDLPRRNMVRVAMTKKGEAAYKHISNRSTMREIMSALSEQEKKELGNILLRLRAKSLKLAGITHNVPLPDDIASHSVLKKRNR